MTFDQLCRELRVTDAEREQLINFLALMRYDATKQALRFPKMQFHIVCPECQQKREVPE